MLAMIGCLAIASLTSAEPAKPLTLFVATNGNDAWSGRLSAPNAIDSDGPFRTLERARDAIRVLKAKGLPSSITIHLRKGTYFLDKTFTLTKEDSGSRGCPITYAAFAGEQVIISGGMPIGGFKPATVNGMKLLVAEAGDAFSQLFVNGQRRPRTRLPKEGYYRIGGLVGGKDAPAWNEAQSAFRFKPGELKQWSDLGDVDIIVPNLWVESRMHPASIDPTSGVVILDRKSTFNLTDDFNPNAFARYWVENALEALDTPGQWYLDRSQRTLYYYPLKGEGTPKLTAIASNLERLIVADGVEYVTFSGLTFSHTEYHYPADKAGSVQAAFEVPAAITFNNCRDCAVERCEISHVGTYAVEAGAGCERIRVQSNRMTDLGAGGVKVQHDSRATTVEDNDIGDGGKVFMSGVGVWVGNSPGNRIVHNHIHDLDYTGVSVGWVWGYSESKASDNLVESNHIHDIGRGVLSDMGGIYTLGTSPGTKLRGNLIHDVTSYSYGGWGIYTDEGSSNILIENNIVYNAKTGGMHQHYGKENVFRNNIFAFSKEPQLARGRTEQHLTFTFERNIVYFSEGDLMAGPWTDLSQRMDYNLYFDTRGKPIMFAGMSLAEWQAKGQDVHSMIADPLFEDPAKHDFHLKLGSPALGLGFKDIDTSNVGPRGAVGPARAR